MPEEITESAKAIQETAKTVRSGIEATQQLGSFVSKITTEPLETVIGILNDRLQFMRWERKLRLAERGRQILDQRGIGELRKIPYKLALPILEYASLEENDELQDLWANLIASAVDPNFEDPIRSAFIDIIRQLEVVDVHILNFAYEGYKQWVKAQPQTEYRLPRSHVIDKDVVVKRLDITSRAYENSIDNLVRVRCLGLLFAHNERFFISSLGISFMAACTGNQ